ncbi:MAG TPA: YsnF/AvaK domain-containing protein, partial [Nocardioides sp.]|nr:YsnF/AvaK domain-containing protein [Nocardioides sp.]
VVPFTKDQVKAAPNVDVDSGHLDQSEERRLYEQYSMTYTERSSDSGLPAGGTGTGTYTDTDTRTTDTSMTDTSHGVVGHDTSGPTTDDAMTRSEERLDVGTTREEAGRVRLRKYVTTEQETVTVPVKKERAVIETEPITDANRGDATSGPAISEEEHEVVLSEERAVVGKTAEPVERVRLDTETVTDEETVTEEVRKEHIEAEGDVHDRRTGA